jgi:16S rRNA (cytidine1402-2'-O)-methyltransferase
MIDPGELFIVSTPIGNLSDITLRALDVLKSVECVACEDTRVTLKLLNKYEIRKPLVSFHAKSSDSALRRIVELIERGNSVALVTDSGTPLVSDPGGRLVQELTSRGVKVTPIPGPSAVHAALAASGFSIPDYTFVGFLSSKPSRRRRELGELRERHALLVFFESPHRLLASLDDALAAFGPVPVCVAKEMTKKFEKYYRGSLENVIKELQQDTVRGEYTVVVDNRRRK